MNKNEWRTPDGFYKVIDHEFKPTLDPCSTKENAKCDKYYTKKEDGLKQSWSNEIVFMNCPYDRDEIGLWMKKAYEEAVFRNATVVCLIPLRGGTKWFHKYVRNAFEIRFILGRIRFEHPNYNNKNGPDFDSILVIFKKGRKDYPIVKFWDWKKELKEIEV